MYGLGSSVDDSPSMPLGAGSGFTQASRQFTATMYLMWLADSAPDTIPVPLGTINVGSGLDRYVQSQLHRPNLQVDDFEALPERLSV